MIILEGLFIKVTFVLNKKIQFILASLIDIDTKLFLFLNGIHSPTWDVIFYWVTSKTFWIPLYVFLFILVFLKYKWKMIYVAIFLGLLFLIADQSSVKLFKDVFERLRPCHNPQITELVHTLYGKCGGQYGFVSSHAANSFALAVFSGFLLRSKYKYILPIMLFWAALVSYSRVYAGVHYPADILGGAILGSVVAILLYWLMKFVNQKFNLQLENT